MFMRFNFILFYYQIVKKRSINSFYNIIVLEPDNRLEEELELDEVQVAQHDRVLD